MMLPKFLSYLGLALHKDWKDAKQECLSAQTQLLLNECEHCAGNFIPYKDLLAVVKRNFPNSFEGLVTKYKASVLSSTKNSNEKSEKDGE